MSSPQKPPRQRAKAFLGGRQETRCNAVPTEGYSTIFNSKTQKLLVKTYGLVSRHFDLQKGTMGRVFTNLYFTYKALTEGASHKHALELARPGTLILDIGANIGFFSVCACRHSLATVLSFEPEPRNYDQLCAAIKARKLDGKIIPNRFAVTDKSGEVNFYLSDLSPMDHKLVDTRTARPIKVQAISIDDFFATVMPEESRAISLIKIDVQGAELKVLSGMKHTLSQHNHPPIFVEYSPGDLRAAGVEPDAFFHAFASLGYVPHDPSTRQRVRRETIMALQSAYADLLMRHEADSDVSRSPGW